MNYVAGLFFSMDMQRFVLIKKNREPPGIKLIGKWNGVGGRIKTKEQGVSDTREIITVSETPHAAMSREFQEEAGVLIPENRWHCFNIQNWQHLKNKVYWMYAAGMEIERVIARTDEEIGVFDWYDFPFDAIELCPTVYYHLIMCKEHVRNGDILCLNPEGINLEKQNPSGIMGPSDRNDADNDNFS